MQFDKLLSLDNRDSFVEELVDRMKEKYTDNVSIIYYHCERMVRSSQKVNENDCKLKFDNEKRL